MTQEPPGTSCVLLFFGNETHLHSVGTAAPIDVPQNVAVRQVTSEFRFDSIAGRKLLAASLRIGATFTPGSAFAAKQRLRIAMRNLRRNLWR